MARYSKQSSSSPFSIGWRLPTMAALLLASWNPSWLETVQPAQIFVVIEDAANLDQADLQRQWSQLVSSFAYLPSNSRISISTDTQLLMDSGPTQGSQLRELGPRIAVQTPDRTAASSLLDLLALANVNGVPPTLVWLGNHQSKSAQGQSLLQALEQQGFAPQFKVEVAQAASTAGVGVSALELPQWVSAGTNLPWQLSLISTTDQPATLEVSLNNGSKTVRQLQLQANQEHHEQGLIATDTSTPSSSAPVRFRVTTATGDVRLQQLINFRGTRNAIYVYQPKSNAAAQDPQPALVKTLGTLGWQVAQQTPNQLAALLQQQATPPVIILDNLAIEDMSDAAWQQLLDRVRFQGSGLIVLGGTRAFGAGGYRHSTLEAALPVTAEPSTPNRPAAVLFVIDQSGSMDAKVAGRRRLDYAQAAVIGSAELLQAGDAIGLLGFANRPHEWLPLAVYSESRSQILSHWSSEVGGATKLAPALSSAIDRLSISPMQQRLLVLVTDGFTEAVDATLIQQQLAQHNIDLIALSIGPDADWQSLSKLTSNPGSKLLSVASSAQLPALMRNNVALQRSALERRAVQPIVLQELPYGPGTDTPWPELTGFLSTKARTGSTVYLSTSEGDPLLVAQRYGLGNVIVLPAGLNQFAPTWPQWEHWVALVRSLTRWANGGADPTQLQLQLAHEARQSHLLVNAVTGTSAWDSTSKITATLSTPNNALVPLLLEPVAPGSYRAQLPLQGQGEYLISVSSDAGAQNTLSFNQYTGQRAQPASAKVGTGSTETLFDTGKLPAWPNSQQQIGRQVVQRLKSPTRSLWLALGLSIFTCGLILEARLDLRKLLKVLKAKSTHINFIDRLQYRNSNSNSPNTPPSNYAETPL